MNAIVFIALRRALYFRCSRDPDPDLWRTRGATHADRHFPEHRDPRRRSRLDPWQSDAGGHVRKGSFITTNCAHDGRQLGGLHLRCKPRP
jgi:hypothetical protein